ncbi:MAG TPA: hypothetical protein VGI83_04045 [Gemmatimonadales bacterium]|jgi:hypothetical protein
MSDDHNLPIDPAEDPALDALIATAGRFPTATAFEDRVIRVVALPLPDWAIKVWAFKTSLLGTTTGRVVLGGLALGSVTSLTMMVNWLRINGQPIGQSLAWIRSQLGVSDWQFSFRALADSLLGLVSGLVPAGMSPRTFVAASAAVVTASAIGLYITAGPPALRSRHGAR